MLSLKKMRNREKIPESIKYGYHLFFIILHFKIKN